METLTVDNTYGKALFDAASERGKIDEIGDEYKAVSEILKDNPLLRKLFLTPTVSATAKKEVARKIFSGRITDELVNFICVLIDKRRIGAWDGIGKQYEKFVWERDGLTKGIIYSVVPLDAKQMKSFQDKAGETLGKNVRLENRIDESLIGGVKIYVDNKLIDASVKSRLDVMKQRIRK